MSKPSGEYSTFALIKMILQVVALPVVGAKLLLENLSLSTVERRIEAERQKKISEVMTKTEDNPIKPDPTFSRDKFPTREKFLEAFQARMVAEIKQLNRGVPPLELLEKMFFDAQWCYQLEEFDTDNPAHAEFAAGALTRSEYSERTTLHRKKFANPTATISLFTSTLISAFLTILRALPPDTFNQHDAPIFATIPLMDRLKDIGTTTLRFSSAFFHDSLQETGLFQTIRNVIAKADERAGGSLDPKAFRGTNAQLVYFTYKDTFQELFAIPIPFPIYATTRMQHWHLISRSGHGKSQTLQHVIHRDILDPKHPCVILIDSQGEMIPKIAQLKAIDPERLVVITPQHFPSLNFLNPQEQHKDTEEIREAMRSSASSLMTYIFSALDSSLSSRMGSTFGYIIRLMQAMPGATMETLANFLNLELGTATKPAIIPAAYLDAIDTLDTNAQSFFRGQYFKGNYKATTTALASRIFGFLDNHYFRRMFCAYENRADFFDWMQSGKVVLVDTSYLRLGDASALFGRIMLAQIFAAATARLHLDDRLRRTTFLIVDEADEYFDAQFETMLRRIRKTGVGLLFAHQDGKQLDTVKSAVLGNTIIKMAGGLQTKDASMMAAEMNTTADFIRSTIHTRRVNTEFALYIDGVTEKAIKVTIPFGTVEDADKRSDTEQSQFLRMNNERLTCAQDHNDKPQQPTPPPPEPPKPATTTKKTKNIPMPQDNDPSQDVY